MAAKHPPVTTASNGAAESDTDGQEDSSTDALSQRRSRNESFDPESEPFKDHHALRLHRDEVSGAVWFMNPTSATFTYLGNAEVIQDEQGSGQQPTDSKQPDAADAVTKKSDISYHWTSRDNRKGRHTLVVRQRSEHYDGLPATTGLASVLKGVWRMVTMFSFWDISYLAAIAFTFAVLVLLTNAILSVLPYSQPGFMSPRGIVYVEGALTLTGCTFFLLSSFLTFIEAVNANTKGCFGWRKEHISYHNPDDPSTEHGVTTRMVPDWECLHRRHNYARLFTGPNEIKTRAKGVDASGNGLSGNRESCGNGDSCGNGESCGNDEQWQFFPTNKELRQTLMYDLGFLACSILLSSSVVYCSSALAELISILTTGEISPWIRIPQAIAGLGFATSSCIFMLETQDKWLTPAWKRIGWHISFWNLVGSLGFTLCAVFGLVEAQEETKEWPEQQLVYSYLWGSSSFLLGSLLQWYESLDKHPVRYIKGEKPATSS